MCPKILFLLMILFSLNYGNIQEHNVKENKCDANISIVCKILVNTTGNLEFIKKNAKTLVHSKDENCLLKLLDSLKTLSLKKKNQKFLIALDSLAKYSDGYVSEHLNSIIPEIFYGNFDSILFYLIKYPKSTLREYLVNGLSLELSISENRTKAKNKIEMFVNEKLKLGQFSVIQKDYMRRILKDINPEMWD